MNCNITGKCSFLPFLRFPVKGAIRGFVRVPLWAHTYIGHTKTITIETLLNFLLCRNLGPFRRGPERGQKAHRARSVRNKVQVCTERERERQIERDGETGGQRERESHSTLCRKPSTVFKPLCHVQRCLPHRFLVPGAVLGAVVWTLSQRVLCTVMGDTSQSHNCNSEYGNPTFYFFSTSEPSKEP